MSRAVGVCALALATLVLVSPAIEEALPTAAAVETLGNDYLLVAAVAVLALAAGGGVLLVRAASGVEETTPPPVEHAAPASPGRDLDSTLDSLPPIRTTERHRRVHARLREAAIRGVTAREQCSRTAARERVERGEWTDDADVASFLASRDLEGPSLARRLRALFGRDNWFRRRVRATVAALETLEGERT